MRHIALGLAALLIAVPAAGAKSFEMDRGSGDLSFRAHPVTDASLMIEEVGRGARISGPADLADSIACVDDKRPLHMCARMKRTTRGIEWRVTRPVRLWHQQAGTYTIDIRGASRLRTVVVSGCGTLTLSGEGSYSADGAPTVSYTPSERVVVKLLP